MNPFSLFSFIFSLILLGLDLFSLLLRIQPFLPHRIDFVLQLRHPCIGAFDVAVQLLLIASFFIQLLQLLFNFPFVLNVEDGYSLQLFQYFLFY